MGKKNLQPRGYGLKDSLQAGKKVITFFKICIQEH